MKAILSALKVAIPLAMTSLKGCYVVADPDFLPVAAQYPCVGLKDGAVIRSEAVGKILITTEEVFIYIYVQLLQNSEASIMGVDNVAPAADIKGLLDLEEDLHTLLDHNNLSVTGVLHSFGVEDLASEIFLQGENVFIQRKACRYVYETRRSVA